MEAAVRISAGRPWLRTRRTPLLVLFADSSLFFAENRHLLGPALRVHDEGDAGDKRSIATERGQQAELRTVILLVLLIAIKHIKHAYSLAFLI